MHVLLLLLLLVPCGLPLPLTLFPLLGALLLPRLLLVFEACPLRFTLLAAAVASESSAAAMPTGCVAAACLVLNCTSRAGASFAVNLPGAALLLLLLALLAPRMLPPTRLLLLGFCGGFCAAASADFLDLTLGLAAASVAIRGMISC
jgi:hypothetical protein